MRAALLAAVLFAGAPAVTAQAAGTITSGPLRLIKPRLGDSGRQWARELQHDIDVISSSAALSGSGTTNYMAILYVGQIGGLPDSVGIKISSVTTVLQGSSWTVVDMLGVGPDGSTVTVKNARLGIGTKNPFTTLEVNGNAQFGSGVTKTTVSASGDITLADDGDLTLSGSGGHIITAASSTASGFFGQAATLANGRLRVSTIASYGPGGVLFEDDGGTDVMFLKDGGDVGVGTTAPVVRLDVRKNAAGAAIMKIKNESASGYSSADYYNNSDAKRMGVGSANASVADYLKSRGYIWTNTNVDFVMHISSKVHMFMANGNVGISTPTPVGNFQVGPSTLVVINGRVGVGTTNPVTALEVNGTITATAVTGDGSALTGVGTAAATALTVSAKVNEAGGISIGQCVYISGATGQFPQVSLCDNTNSAKREFFGLAAETKADSQTVLVRFRGELTAVDTDGTGVPGVSESWSDGDPLYMITGGNLSDTMPTSGAVEHIAFVSYAHGTTGKLIAISHREPTIGAASGEDFVRRMGDSAGANKMGYRDYENVEVAHLDSNGNYRAYGAITAGHGSATASTLAANGDLTLGANGDLTLAGSDGHIITLASANASGFHGQGFHGPHGEMGEILIAAGSSTNTISGIQDTVGVDTQTHADLTGSSAHGAASAATPDQIVTRDGEGSFAVYVASATEFQGPLVGAVTGNVTGDVTGNVTGDVTGNVTGDASGNAGTATAAESAGTTAGSGDLCIGVDASWNCIKARTDAAAVNGSTNAAQSNALYDHAALTDAHGAVSAATPGKIVLRDGSGDFAAHDITANLFSGPLTGNVTGDASGNAGTATAAAAAGTIAGSGAFAVGVDASWNAVTGTVDAAAANGSTNPVQSNALYDHDAKTGSSAHGAVSAATPIQLVTRDAQGSFAAYAATFTQVNVDGGAFIGTTAKSTFTTGGVLTLPPGFTPTADQHASTKKYVDDFSPVAGGGWADDGGTVRLISPSDDVSIGDADAATKLDVEGAAQFGSGVAKSTFSSVGSLSLASNADLTLTGPTAYATFPASVTASSFHGDGAGLDMPVLALSSATFSFSGNVQAGGVCVSGSTITVTGTPVDIYYAGKLLEANSGHRAYANVLIDGVRIADGRSPAIQPGRGDVTSNQVTWLLFNYAAGSGAHSYCFEAWSSADALRVDGRLEVRVSPGGN